VTFWICTPAQPRVTYPLSLSCAVTILAVVVGMAKPMPTEPPEGHDRGVHAHHLAFGVEGRPARVAFVDRRIDLDEVVIRTRADVAATGGDDAGRHGLAQAERIADRNHPVADSRRLIGELHIGKIAPALDLDQGEVGLLVGADHLGWLVSAVAACALESAGSARSRYPGPPSSTARPSPDTVPSRTRRRRQGNLVGAF
jgi:hypothetical protein